MASQRQAASESTWLPLPAELDVHPDGLVAGPHGLRRAVGARRRQEQLERAVRRPVVPPVERVLDLDQDRCLRPPDQSVGAGHPAAVALEEHDADGHPAGGVGGRLAGAGQGAEADGELGQGRAVGAPHHVVEHRRRRRHRSGRRGLGAAGRARGRRQPRARAQQRARERGEDCERSCGVMTAPCHATDCRTGPDAGRLALEPSRAVRRRSRSRPATCAREDHLVTFRLRE